MNKTIKVIVDIDEEDFKEFIEEEGGEYNENCLYEDLNGALDNLPFCAFVVGYKIIGEELDDE